MISGNYVTENQDPRGSILQLVVRRLSQLALPLFLVLLVPTIAAACTCRPNPLFHERFAKAKNVFVAKVLETDEIIRADRSGTRKFMKRFQFVVSENIKGRMAPTAETYYDENEICPDKYFQTGESYLVFAYKIEGDVFAASACGGTGILAESKRELSYARRLQKKEQFSTIFGILQPFRYERNPNLAALNSIDLTLTSSAGRKFQTTTDEQGRFEFAGVTVGDYGLTIGLPNGLWHYRYHGIRVTRSPFALEINPVAYIDGKISGVMLSADGSTVANRLIFLWELDRRINVPFTSAKTDTEGKFVFYGLPSGRFTLHDYLPDTYHRYDGSDDKIYLGSVRLKEDAEIISLGFAEHRKGIVFRYPLEPPQIKGSIRDESGSLITEANVIIQYSNSEGLRETKINAWEGEFSLPVFDGYKLKIYAYATYGPFKGRKSPVMAVSKADVGKPITLIIGRK